MVMKYIFTRTHTHTHTHTNTHNHRSFCGDCDGIGQSDQRVQAGWESLERKAVVWCLISHARGQMEGERESKRVCVCKRQGLSKRDEGV